MKKILATMLLLAFLAPFIVAQARETHSFDFIKPTAIASIASLGTATNGVEFTSEDIILTDDVVVLFGKCTIASANGEDIVFSYQASYDDGVTWTTDAFCTVTIPSVTGTMIRGEEKLCAGVRRLRLWTVYNGDAVTAITTVNSTASMER